MGRNRDPEGYRNPGVGMGNLNGDWNEKPVISKGVDKRVGDRS